MAHVLLRCAGLLARGGLSDVKRQGALRADPQRGSSCLPRLGQGRVMSGRRWRTGGFGWWRGGIDWTRSGWWAGGVAGSAGFVGRERELSSLRGALGGDARLLLVTGDAGVGKTRFVGEGMRSAAAGGMVSVLGGCLPLAGKLPLLPVADALGELSRLDGGRLLEAAMDTVPPYVRVEVGRLLPQLGTGELGLGSRGEGWQQERLFSAVAELLGAVAGRSGLGVVVEDVHWADSATLDCLTYLARPGRRDPLTMVVTFRSDEVPLDAQVADWLAHVRGGGGVEEIGLGPLSRAEVAEQIAGLVGGRAPGELVDDLYARAEGNPFFTEQLAAAALAEPAGGGLGPPSGLPARLAELLAARAGGCGADAGAVLAGLALAGRPLSEGLFCDVTGLDVDAVRDGLRELTAARLLAASTAEGGIGPGMRCWPRPWPRDCCPVSGRCCMSARRGRWRRRAGCRRRRWLATGPPRAALPRSCRPGWRQPRPPSRCSASPKRRCTGSGQSSCAGPRLPSRPASMCRGCTCAPSTRLRYPATVSAPVLWRRRHTAGSLSTPTLPPQRSSASAPRVCGGLVRRPLGCR